MKAVAMSPCSPMYGQRNRLYKTVESRKDVETFVYQRVRYV